MLSLGRHQQPGAHRGPGGDLADVESVARAAVHRRDGDSADAVDYQQRQATGDYLGKVWYFVPHMLSSLVCSCWGSFSS